MRIEAGLGMLAAAGLLVGIGTSYGSGCSSGHGVCGTSTSDLSWEALYSASAGALPASAPGLALVAFASGVGEAAIFTATMLSGMAICTIAERFIHAPRRETREERRSISLRN